MRNCVTCSSYFDVTCRVIQLISTTALITSDTTSSALLTSSPVVGVLRGVFATFAATFFLTIALLYLWWLCLSNPECKPNEKPDRLFQVDRAGRREDQGPKSQGPPGHQGTEVLALPDDRRRRVDAHFAGPAHRERNLTTFIVVPPGEGRNERRGTPVVVLALKT
jgi:hypothetical protein